MPGGAMASVKRMQKPIGVRIREAHCPVEPGSWWVRGMVDRSSNRRLTHPLEKKGQFRRSTHPLEREAVPGGLVAGRRGFRASASHDLYQEAF